MQHFDRSASSSASSLGLSASAAGSTSAPPPRKRPRFKVVFGPSQGSSGQGSGNASASGSGSESGSSSVSSSSTVSPLVPSPLVVGTADAVGVGVARGSDKSTVPVAVPPVLNTTTSVVDVALTDPYTSVPMAVTVAQGASVPDGAGSRGDDDGGVGIAVRSAGVQCQPAAASSLGFVHTDPSPQPVTVLTRSSVAEDGDAEAMSAPSPGHTHVAQRLQDPNPPPPPAEFILDAPSRLTPPSRTWHDETLDNDGDVIMAEVHRDAPRSPIDHAADPLAPKPPTLIVQPPSSPTCDPTPASALKPRSPSCLQPAAQSKSNSGMLPLGESDLSDLSDLDDEQLAALSPEATSAASDVDSSVSEDSVGAKAKSTGKRARPRASVTAGAKKRAKRNLQLDGEAEPQTTRRVGVQPVVINGVSSHVPAANGGGFQLAGVGSGLGFIFGRRVRTPYQELEEFRQMLNPWDLVTTLEPAEFDADLLFFKRVLGQAPPSPPPPAPLPHTTSALLSPLSATSARPKRRRSPSPSIPTGPGRASTTSPITVPVRPTRGAIRRKQARSLSPTPMAIANTASTPAVSASSLPVRSPRSLSPNLVRISPDHVEVVVPPPTLPLSGKGIRTPSRGLSPVKEAATVATAVTSSLNADSLATAPVRGSRGVRRLGGRRPEATTVGAESRGPRAGARGRGRPRRGEQKVADGQGSDAGLSAEALSSSVQLTGVASGSTERTEATAN
ncbi:hypothetical protein BCR44DRAFT_195414 [Catenaria anguillulae PL171]|uniref:Uncharacterized protein n=1 Tax=Catenaria anguillulae PL171 TaxID=765915 RepID=A0A1Y2HPM6_9FUNG|nr:hypothetical protein BCR44DRAFT_195414 [Catenaria anguillulae PL171]